MDTISAPGCLLETEQNARKWNARFLGIRSKESVQAPICGSFMAGISNVNRIVEPRTLSSIAVQVPLILGMSVYHHLSSSTSIVEGVHTYGHMMLLAITSIVTRRVKWWCISWMPRLSFSRQILTSANVRRKDDGCCGKRIGAG